MKCNVALDRSRVNRFLAEESETEVVLGLRALLRDARACGAPITSIGKLDPHDPLRAERLWEYALVARVLELDRGGKRVLDLGGAASPIVYYAAARGNEVLSLDINPELIRAGETGAQRLGFPDRLTHRIGDMRALAGLEDRSFDAVMSVSVLEHLTARDQMASVREMARVLRSEGRVGLTFDYGPPAPGANDHLPPPHEPPGSGAQVLERYVRASGLEIYGNKALEEPRVGALWNDPVVKYCFGSLFLRKPSHE